MVFDFLLFSVVVLDFFCYVIIRLVLLLSVIFKVINCCLFFRDMLIVFFINCGMSIFVGFVIFMMMGYMSYIFGVLVFEVVKGGKVD